MNWAKGRRTKGRGTSFKGALQYVLHDKGAATSERVGTVSTRNMATDDPHQAWREMMTLCDAADDLKARAGGKASGRKLKQPVYAFTLNWHEEDRPDAAHMHATAESALEALGMEGLQAVIVEHTDTPHRHVHIIVNLVDPETGKAAALSNDNHKLDRWADRYEVGQGVIRSPDRRAKFEALDRGQKPPKRPQQAASREEWEATRRLQTRQAKERAAAIKAGYAARTQLLKEKQKEGFLLRRAEGDRLWKGYKQDRDAIRDRYKPFIDAIYKSRRKAAPHPYTEQALRDLQETAEWRELGRSQFAERKLLNTRERFLLGRLANAVRLHNANLRRGGISGLFLLAVSRKHRQKLYQEVLQGRKEALQKSQAQRRKGRADALRAACRHELGERAAEFKRQRTAMLDRHAGEIATQKEGWRQLATERDKAWADFRKNMELSEKQRTPAAASGFRGEFNDVAAGRLREVGRTEAKGTAQGSKDGGSEAVTPAQKEGKQGWRARRKAAERKDEGVYKPRDRGRGRTRGPRR